MQGRKSWKQNPSSFKRWDAVVFTKTGRSSRGLLGDGWLFNEHCCWPCTCLNACDGSRPEGLTGRSRGSSAVAVAKLTTGPEADSQSGTSQPLFVVLSRQTLLCALPQQHWLPLEALLVLSRSAVRGEMLSPLPY